MFNRKFSDTIRRKKKIIYVLLITFVMLLGIGYAAFESNLSIGGTLDVKGYMEPTLYNVIKREALTGGLAREYTGEHGDSMDASKSTEKIYHWYAETNAQGTQILDKNNVIFAGQCWQMIRTTDTGGVKMIYNGEAENNQCLNTRGNHVGYAERTSQTLSSNYWYGTDYTYDSTNKLFSISGTTEQATWNATTGPNLIGKYTCKQTTESGTCSTLYLIESYNDTSNAYVISLNANSHYSQFGTLQFNANNDSPADVGYMYNTRYISNSKTMTNSETMFSRTSLNTTYWYGDSVTWGSPTANRYNLDNPSQVSSTDEYPGLVGKYTFRNTSQTYTDTSVYYIAAVNGTNMYCIQLSNSGNHTLADFNYTYTYGDSYQDNGNGTYTIKNEDQSNPSTVNRSDWYTAYNNVGAGKYVCKNAVNDTCSNLWYTTSTGTDSMGYMRVTDNYKYSKSFEYKLDPDDNTYKYFLDDATSTTFWDIRDNTNKTSLNNAHYTCWNEVGKCAILSYIYYFDNLFTRSYYINLENGKSVDDAKNEMLYNNDVNQINSTIKSGVDAWYKKYILPNDEQVEDTIFCNNRSQINTDTNGWNPNGGNLLSTGMYFKDYNYNSDLSCTNETDKFSISNSVAHLTYKVGLMTLPELYILAIGNARKSEQNYLLASPSSYYISSARGRYVSTTGYFSTEYVYLNYGVRPSISLEPGTEFAEGDGSMANPYYVGETYNITNTNNLFNIKEKAPPNYEVQLYSADYVVTSFKLNGTLINGDTFIMPNEDVTITDIQYITANYSITNTDNDITVPNTGRYGSTITLESENYKVKSFKLNGTLVNGDSFVMPAENVTITEITKTPQVTVESEHNPYPNSVDNQIMYENTFENATSLTVKLTYQTEGTGYDWIYLYDDANSTTPVNNKKYGGSTLKTETLTINSNYLKILFRTDSSGNNYYGFKAVITPNYN